MIPSTLNNSEIKNWTIKISRSTFDVLNERKTHRKCGLHITQPFICSDNDHYFSQIEVHINAFKSQNKSAYQCYQTYNKYVCLIAASNSISYKPLMAHEPMWAIVSNIKQIIIIIILIIFASFWHFIRFSFHAFQSWLNAIKTKKKNPFNSIWMFNKQPKFILCIRRTNL